jgi:hypothetical protein
MHRDDGALAGGLERVEQQLQRLQLARALQRAAEPS